MQLTSLFWVLAGSAVHVAAGPPSEPYPDHYTEHYGEHRTYSDHDHHHTWRSDDHGDHHHTISYSDHHGDHHGGYTKSHGDHHHHHNATTVTSIVTAITTYCPKPTTFTHGTRTYTVTKATTLTILDCPCTVTEVLPVKPTHPPPPPCKGPDCPCIDDHCHPPPCKGPECHPPPPGTITHKPTQPPPTKPISPPIVTAAAGRVQEGVAGLAIALGAVALAAL